LSIASLQQLQYFLAVAEEGQMTRAASKLHLAQPALSRAVRQLESRLAVQLLVRHSRGVSLTPAGEAFLAKARVAVSAATDAELAAKSFARGAGETLEVGFIGPPPLIKAPELFAALAGAYPEVEVSARELPFPRGATASWLQDVDVALCHPPRAEAEVSVQTLRTEPRAVVLPKNHPLAHRDELTVAWVLDETFIGFHPDVQPTWAGFHNLDDHRGRPPGSTTADRVLSPSEMLARLTSRKGITTVPFGDAAIILKVLRGVVAIPLRDARPALLSLLWRWDAANPLVEAIVATARDLTMDRRTPGTTVLA
jgi:DNA-binding transcriptional LysR family regulator